MKRERTREHLTQEEVQKLLAATKKEGLSRNPQRDHCLLFMMVRHGLRVSEACQLKLSDIDLERKTIYVHRLNLHFPVRPRLLFSSASRADRDVAESDSTKIG